MPVDEIARNAFGLAVEDESELRAALLDSDAVTTLMVAAHLSGDTTLLERAREHITGPLEHERKVPRSLHEEAVEKLIKTLRRLASGAPAPTLSEADLNKIMSLGVGEEVPAEFLPMAQHETQLDGGQARQLRWTKDPAELLHGFSVVVIGAGVSGIAAGVRLREAGIPFVILEKNETLGGTWWENKYPGCAVDVPGDTYAYSFFPNTVINRSQAKRDDILAYLEACTQAHGLGEDIIYDAQVSEIQFLDDTKHWQVKYTKEGVEHTLTPNVVISAVGGLNRPRLPNMEGLDEFTGEVLHTAAWDDKVDLTGRRVALIGTGSSGSQVGPAIAPIVGHLDVFQRQAHWRRLDPTFFKERAQGEVWSQRNVPYFAAWRRFLTMWAGFDRNWKLMLADSKDIEAVRADLIKEIERELGDRTDLIASATPDYRPFAKRMIRDSYWFRMLRRENVSLVTTAIERFTKDGIRTADGVDHPLDVVIFATGFDTTRAMSSYEVIGKGGVNIRSLWANNDPRAYFGVTAPELPNLFMTFGPNSVPAHGGSFMCVAECQVDYALQAIQQLVEGGYASVEVRQSVHDDYNKRQDELNARMCWSLPGVSNWFRNTAGRVTMILPWRLVDFWNMTRRFKPDEYDWTR